MQIYSQLRAFSDADKEKKDCSNTLLLLPPPVSAPLSLRLLRQQIQSLMQYGYPSISQVAKSVRMSPRSFQRYLAKNHFTYTVLVEQVRYETAIRWLQDPSVKIVEIAMNLGYGDSSSFCHAFKRWTGLSPRQFRQRYVKSNIGF